LRDGDLLGLYAISYSSGRFVLEFWKLDAPAFGQGLTIAQVVSLIVALVGLAFLIIRHRAVPNRSSAEPAV
jgi:prolipoprotein diacylglyceryltransferase